MKIIEFYKEILNYTRILSKITSFLIVIFLLVEIFRSLCLYSFYAPQEWLNRSWTMIYFSLGFQLLITIIFATRFVFLWLKDSKFLWFSQIFWLIGWLSILAYDLISAKITFGSFFGFQANCMDCFYYDTFISASASLTVILFAYLFLSPIKQIIIFVSALMSKVFLKSSW